MSSIVINYRYQSIATGDWYRLISSVSIDFRYRFLSIDYACFSGDKLQQLVAATDHSMCTGRATSCSNTVRRHVAATNRFVCTGEFLWKFVSTTEFYYCNKSQKIKSDWICATCCGDKILLQRQRFSQKFSTQNARSQNDIVSIPPFYCVYSCLNRK